MTAFARLVDAGSVSRAATEEANYQKLAAQSIGRELRDADEANLIDEEDMHIFGLRPMTDPLDLVCCNACKKPIKASQYATHAELCKLLNSRAEINLELNGPAVTRKPPRKERKKSLITQSKKAKSLRESKKTDSVDSGDIAAPASHIDENIPISVLPEARRETHLTTDKANGSTVNPYDVDCLKYVKCSSKPLKRTSAENRSNQGTESFCKSAAEVSLPQYVPAPLATKVYYSQRGHNLRRAISRMFFEEPDKEFSNEVEDLQVNAALGQTLSPGTFCHEQVACQQQGQTSTWANREHLNHP